MRIIRLNSVSNFLKLEPETLDDLYLLAMIISEGDIVEAQSSRRFRGNETDVGEQKEVTIRIRVERAEIDKNAARLRVSGKIIYGKPEEFVTMNSYHTLNIAARDIIDVHKDEWKEYILKRIKRAVSESKKPRMGIIVMDDEKALIAYVRGYGIDIVSEHYSRLSKRMKEKDYAAKREGYFKEIIGAMENMKVDIIVVAGPGFTKDDLKKYMEDAGKTVEKRLVYVPASDADKSGIREVMVSNAVANVLENDQIRREFELLNVFLAGLRAGTALHGIKAIYENLHKRRLSAILVGDDMINRSDVKELLDEADREGIRIEIFNSDDDAGAQLRNFSGVAAIQ